LQEIGNMCDRHKSSHATLTIPRVTLAALLLVITAVLLAGCTVGPKFVKPKVQMNQTWCQSDSTLITREKLDSAWWNVFCDSTLDSLIKLAYHQNLPLQVAGLRIMQARAQLAQAVGKQFPQTQVVFGEVNAVGVGQNIATPLGLNRNFVTYQTGLDVSWEADFWGKYRNNVKAQKANFFGSISDYDNALVSLTAEVARTYIAIRTYEELIDQALLNVQLQDSSLQITRVRYQHGAAPELDVSQATTLLESTRASIPKLEISLIQARNALCTLIGQPTGTIDTLLQKSRGIPTVPAEIPVIIPAKLLERRPDVQSAGFSAMAQAAQVGFAKSQLYPQLNLSGLIFGQTFSNLGVPTGGLFNSSNIWYAVGPRLAWPILNYGQITNGVRVQDALLQQSLVNYQNTVLKAAQEVEDGLSGYIQSKRQSNFELNAVKSAQRSVELALVQYRNGAVDYTRVLDAQSSLLQKENSLTQSCSSIANYLISVYKALGGGWELRNGQPVVPDSTRVEMQHRTNWGNLLKKTIIPANSDTSTLKKTGGKK
jgi:NodT family efflux transporter outer membrane factor (OMF) lipoprotein